MKKSEKTDKILGAFCKFQKQIDNPEKNKTVKVRTNKGKNYSYDYVTLDKIVGKIQKIASEHGLSFSQEVSTSNGGTVSVSTYLFHESGQWIKFGPLQMSVEKNGRMNINQAAGSTITYARRYALSSMAGIASEEDTDTHEMRGQRDKSGSAQNRTKPNQATEKLDMIDIQTRINKQGEKWSELAFSDDPSDKMLAKFNAWWSENIGDDDSKRYKFLSNIVGRDIESSKKVLKGEMAVLLELITNESKAFKKLVRKELSGNTGDT